MDKLNLLDIINTLANKNTNTINHNTFCTITNFSNSFFFSRIINKQYTCLRVNYLQSFYYNIFYILNKDVSIDSLTDDMVINMKNKLILNITKNKSFFKYITNKCKKNSLIEFIEHNESNEYILQYISEVFNITIIVLDCEIDKIILYYANDMLDTYCSIFIFTKYNNEYAILFENNKCEFNYNDVPWLFNNLDCCERCNLEFKLGNQVIFNKKTINKYIKQPNIIQPKLSYIINKSESNKSASNKSILTDIKLITNINKISLHELQHYANKLNIPIKIKTSNGKKEKNKTKQQLYNEITKS